MENARFVQIGFTALRDPVTGDYLPAVPMYIRAEDAERTSYKKPEDDAVATLAGFMKRYVKECREAGTGA